MVDRPRFFALIRQTLFAGKLSRSQTEGLTFLLDRWVAMGAAADDRLLAYVLATAYHETARAMQPLRERGGAAYLRRSYDVEGRDPARARANGNTEPGDGIRYAGRGYVQLTWRANYARAGALLGLDLVADPDLALEPGTAADILVRGMLEGWFTGRKLPEFFTASKSEWAQARRTVNGLDRAADIGRYARLFLAALRAGVKPSAPPRPRAPAPRPRRASR